MSVIVRSTAAAFSRQESIRLEAGDWATVSYDVEIDWQLMPDLVRKAVRNKSKMSKDGPIKVYIRKVTPHVS